jgi:hypothetical protein
MDDALSLRGSSSAAERHGTFPHAGAAHAACSRRGYPTSSGGTRKPPALIRGAS